MDMKNDDDQPATRRDLKMTEKHILETEKRLARAIVDTQARVQKIEETMMTRADGDRIFSVLDFIRGKILDRERRLRRLEAKA